MTLILSIIAFICVNLCFHNSIFSQENSDLQNQVDELIEELRGDNIEVRENATRKLVSMGVKIEPYIRTIAEKEKNIDVKVRLESILQKFLLIKEEEYALNLIKKNIPFPKTEKIRFHSQKETIQEILDEISRFYKIDIEFYPGDIELKNNAQSTVLDYGFSAVEAEECIFTVVTEEFDATYVFDGEKIVIVRLTPAILFEKLKMENIKDFSYIEMIVNNFREKKDFRTSMAYYLQHCVEEGGERREKWWKMLEGAAREQNNKLEDRCLAVKALRYFYGAVEETQPATTKVFIDILKEKNDPMELKKEASAALAECMESEAIDLAFEILESNDSELQKPLIYSMLSNFHNMYCLSRKIREDIKSLERLKDVLKKLETASDLNLSVMSVVFQVKLGIPDAEKKLLQLKETEELTTTMIILDGLNTYAHRNQNAVQDKLEEFSRSSKPEVRAGVAFIYGRMAGGENRQRDVKGALALIDDPEAIVRWAAVSALDAIYSTSAVKPFTDGLEECLEKIKNLSKNEKHPKVKEVIVAMLSELGQD